MKDQNELFYQALITRDYRFDGKFFVGVKTTGIYCRPICPARPKKENIEFFPDALAAEKAGYRPCLRCRPECAPQSPAWHGRNTLVQQALKLIANNLLADLDENAFAKKIGVSARHLRRLFAEEIGKTPKQIWDNNRLDFARKLIVETPLPLTEIAFTAGFSSVRRFNDAIQQRFQRSPSALRKNKTAYQKQVGIELSLAYRPPFDWQSLLDFYQAHQIIGVETIHSNAYERVFMLDGNIGALRLEPGQKDSELKLTIITENHKNIFLIVQNIRRMFDLDSDPIFIAKQFSSSKIFKPLLKKYPGLRIANAWDPFESAICTILGQLVSVKQAKHLVGQLVHHYGTEIKNPLTGNINYLFPSAEILAHANLAQLGTTQKRKNTIREFSQLVLAKKISLIATQDPQAFKEALLKIKGIGHWTTEYICLRALGDTDAFPQTDLILKRALEVHPQLNLNLFKPWRAYAAVYLWKEFAQSLSQQRRNKHD